MKKSSNQMLSFSSFLFFVIMFVSLALTITAQEVEDEREFDYRNDSGRGPEHWGDIKEEWALCKTGKLQSPIDLFPSGDQIIPPNSEKIFKFYKPAKAVLLNRGHDIEVKWENEDNKIQINGKDYILRQCHWHSPSEHTGVGRRFDLELHMVHQSQNDDIAVTGFLYSIGNNPDPFLDELTEKIKLLANSSLEEIDAGMIDPSKVREEGRFSFRYLGSLTTPPCTEGVIWTVNNKITSVSKDQIALLKQAVNDGGEGNARPIQPLNGRRLNLYVDLISDHVDQNYLSSY